jgi:hypothetical protein
MNMKHFPGLLVLATCPPLVMASVESDRPPAIPPTPAPVLELVSARTFTLEAGYTHLWRSERPQADSGYLLVLRVDPALVYPRQVAEPVLYVGQQTAERINIGYESGHVVAIVPAVLDDPEHADFIDLCKAPIWFGTPELPERVGAKRIARERLRAERSGIRPASAEAIARATKRGGRALAAEDKLHLLRESAALVRRYAPDEVQLVERLLQPRPRARK